MRKGSGMARIHLLTASVRSGIPMRGSVSVVTICTSKRLSGPVEVRAAKNELEIRIIVVVNAAYS